MIEGPKKGATIRKRKKERERGNDERVKRNYTKKQKKEEDTKKRRKIGRERTRKQRKEERRVKGVTGRREAKGGKRNEGTVPRLAF